MTGVKCLTEIIFAIACTVHGTDPGAQKMNFGPAVVVQHHGSFSPLPDVGPIVYFASRPMKRRATIAADEVSYASSYAPTKDIFESFRKKRTVLYTLIDGNEQMDCIVKNAKLMRIMDKVHKHYGKELRIESAYRSSKYNRKVSGAKNSAHMRCNAVDFEIIGVDKFALAKYLRTIKGVGGVGTYCSSNPVHIDVERKRSWHWDCKSKTKRRRKK